jgi:glycerol-3-phosphate acyltransferase PlsX
MKNIKIAFDVMGSEFEIIEAYKAAKIFTKKHNDVELILVGDKTKLEPLNLKSKFEIIHAEDFLVPEDSLISARRKTKSSLNVAIELVKSNKADALISAAPTIPFVGSMYMNFGMIEGIKKPGFLP